LLWYGYIYYLFFNITVLISTFFLLRIYLLNFIGQSNSFSSLSRLFLASMVFAFFFMFTSLNYLLDYYSELVYISNSASTEISLISTFTISKLININSVSLNLVQVYYYPFIYVFLLITILSIIFCLTYNYDELFSFMFYCQIILIAGYVLFFTDSLVLFFLAYEMLLVPSFFILYKFAKTRRCVEAAYLMFF
jgi:formate hydrogenlyase subunit 3/multisubunit Na+/H+ antiporter MnhD subunit